MYHFAARQQQSDDETVICDFPSMSWVIEWC